MRIRLDQWRFYLGNNDELIHIRLQVWQSAYAHQRLAYYSKQAITGDLDDSNTNNVIGDWGITNDAPVNFTPTGATYDPATGVMGLLLEHSLTLGRFITIADNSLIFTCSQDGNGSNHTGPRSTDPASGVNLRLLLQQQLQLQLMLVLLPLVNNMHIHL